MNIIEIIKKGESERVEFKESLAEIKEILQTIVAFANSKGGIILIGVNDNGEIKGVNIGKNTVEDLVVKIENSISPKIFPEVSMVTVEGKRIIKISVEEGKNKPYFLRGKCFKRVGKNNIKMSGDEIKKVIEEKIKAWELVERRLVGNLNDIDKEKVKEFINKMYFYRKTKFSGNELEFLKKLGVIVRNRVTLAGILLFGKWPQAIVPYACVKLMRKVNGKIVEADVAEGRIDEQIDKTISFIRKYIPKEYQIIGGRREEIWVIPEEVIREMVVNAIVHRDYSIPSPIIVKYVDEEIIITNPGDLLPPLTLDDLYKSHPSILRNPIIGRCLFLLNYIEGWGEGISTSIELCRKANCPIPIFKEEKGFFTVIIKVRKENLNENEKVALKMAQIGVTSKELAKVLSISERTAREILRNLYDRGYLKRKRIGREVIYLV